MIKKFKIYISKALKSDFLKNIGKLMSGTGFAHLVAIAIIPVLTRIYTPEEIGIYAAFVSIFNICYCVASLRYEYATLIPTNNISANNITALALTVSLSSTLIVTAILILFANPIASTLNISALGWLIYFIPLAMFSYSFFMILSLSLNRYQKYGAIAGGKITVSSTMATGQVLLGLLRFKEAGLVLGKVASDMAGAIFLLWHRHKLQLSISAGVSSKRMMAMAKRHKNFALYNAPHALTTTLSNNFPVLLFNSFFSEAIAGFYAMAAKALYTPIRVVAQAGYQVFSQRIAEKFGHKEPLLPFIRSTLLLLAGGSFLPFLLLFFLSPPLFSWFLGADWEITGRFVRILTPYIFLVFIVTPLNFIPLMLNRQRKAFAVDLVYLFSRLSALGVGIYYQNVYLSLVLYTAVGIAVNSYLLVWYYALAQKAEKYEVRKKAKRPSSRDAKGKSAEK